MQSVNNSGTAKTTPKDWNPNFPYLEVKLAGRSDTHIGNQTVLRVVSSWNGR